MFRESKYNLSNFIETFFEVLADYIIAVPWLFILLPILLSMSLGFYCKDFVYSKSFWEMFTPTNSPSWYETRVYNEFNELPHQTVTDDSPVDVEGTMYFFIDVYISLPNESPILYSNYTGIILKTITTIETLEYSYKGAINTFKQFCKLPGIDCPDTNLPVKLFIDLFFNIYWRNNERVSFTYPVAQLINVRVELSDNFFGFIPAEEKRAKIHDSTTPSSAVIEQFRLVKLRFLAGAPVSKSANTEDEMRAFAKGVQSFAKGATRNESELKFSFNAWYLLAESINQNAQVAIPKLGLGIFGLMLFAVISCISLDCSTGKVWEGVAGVVSSLMAVVSTFGLMMWSNNISSGMVILMPFVVISIGIDDTFVLLGSWVDTKRSLSPIKRLKTAMKTAGVSVTITSLTDVISFAFGTLSSTPAVSSFCLYVAIGVMFDFIYQITFMPAVIYYGGIREANGQSYCLCCVKTTCTTWTGNDKTKMTGDIIKETSVNAPKKICSNFWKAFIKLYVDVLSKPVIFIFVLMITVTSWIICIYAIFKLKVGMDIRKLLVDNSPMLDVVDFVHDYVWDEGISVSVIVNYPPNLNDEKERNAMLKMIDQFERMPFSIGQNGTDAWLRKCNLFYQNGVYKSFWHAYDGWKGIAGNDFYNQHIKLGDANTGDPHLRAYKFVITVNHQRDWGHRRAVADYSRNLARKYSRYNVTVFEIYNLYVDQVTGLPLNVALTVGCALAIMILVLMLCIPNIVIIYAILSMLAINLGVIGVLSLTGHDLDPIALAAIITCIGLSVDFTLHVTHYFSRNHNHWAAFKELTETELVTKAVVGTLESLMWPMLQGGLSTFFGIFVLQFTPSNMMRVIFLEVSTVIWLGFWYGLVFMPTMFLNIDNRFCKKQVVCRMKASTI